MYLSDLYSKAQKRPKYYLTEEMVAEMARMTRLRDPEKKWPSREDGIIDPEIVRIVTGDPNWQVEKWGNIDSAGKCGSRGLCRSLAKTLDALGCSYNLTEEMVAEMARMTRARHPEKKWPTGISHVIDPQIVFAVTNDPHWPPENWKNINEIGKKGNRGLRRGLSETLHAHGCHYNLTEEMVTEMARMTRARDPEKKWPNVRSGDIDPKIVSAVTGDAHWQAETWVGIHSAGNYGSRGLRRSLAKILEAHGCSYNLTEGMVVEMARMTRARDPEKKWPTGNDGVIDPEIVFAVTNDPHWPKETWNNINTLGRRGNRGLRRSLSQILDAHFPDRKEGIKTVWKQATGEADGHYGLRHRAEAPVLAL